MLLLHHQRDISYDRFIGVVILEVNYSTCIDGQWYGIAGFVSIGFGSDRTVRLNGKLFGGDRRGRPAVKLDEIDCRH